MPVRLRLPAPLVYSYVLNKKVVSVAHSSCIFCRIVSKEMVATIIAENTSIVVIKDASPQAPIHYLIIPRKHIPNLQSFQDSDIILAGEMLLMARHLSTSMGYLQQFRLVMNNGDTVGQTVFHAHCHYLAGSSYKKSENNLV